MTTTTGSKTAEHDRIGIDLARFGEALAGYAAGEQKLLEWLWDYAHDELQGSRAALVEALGYDWTVIYKVLTGQYEASLKRFCAAIRHLQEQVKAGHAAGRLVETIVTKRIREALEFARNTNSMVTITGTTGRSKTFAAKHWVRSESHAGGRYVRVPSKCTRKQLVQLLCEACGIRIKGQTTADLEQQLYGTLTFRHTVVLDEAGHLMPRGGRGTSAIEVARDLHDICGCGVVLVMTDVYLTELHRGRQADFFEQFVGRIRYELKIPDAVRRDETRAVVAAFCPTPGPKLVAKAHELANSGDGRLRSLFADLTRARDWAASHSRSDISVDDLKLVAQWRHLGGHWPEEGAV